MKEINMQTKFLEQFIVDFLPEGKLVKKPEAELTAISMVLHIFFPSQELPVLCEQIFDIFFTLQYPISVVEPTRQEHTLKPYITTNSHTIYVAIDRAKLQELKALSIIYVQKKSPIPSSLKEMYNALQKFNNDNT